MKRIIRKLSKEELLVIFLSPISIFVMTQFVYNGGLNSYNLGIIIANYLCITFVFMLILLISNKVLLSSILSHIIFLVWAIANYFVSLYRGNPVLPWDLTALGTAKDVFMNYKYYPTLAMIISIIYIIGLAYFLSRYLPKGHYNYKYFNRSLAMCLMIASFILIGSPKKAEAYGVRTDVWNPAKAYRENGTIATFIANLKFLKVEKPENYDNVDVIMNNYEDKWDNVSDIKPNIIAIMNESWADYEEFGNLKLKNSVMDNIKSIDNIYFGHTYTSVYGAGTSASEFEFLTGNTMAFLPSGSIPYQQYILSPSSSIASILKEQGYSTNAFHPGDINSWNRNKAYPLLGFDGFKSREDMDVIIKETHSEYVSDKSNFDQLIYDYEHRDKTKPYFYFNVTIGSHGGYTDKTYPNQNKILGHANEFEKAEEYLTLLEETDIAFKELIDYFKTVNEPVIILMFGDHQPSLEAEFNELAYGVKQDKMNMQAYMNKFRTPYVMWANYDLDIKEDKDTSLNFLGQKLLYYAGVETNEYGKYLWDFKDKINALSFVGYHNGIKAYSHLENNRYTKKIKEYQAIQYNNLFGDDARNDEFFKVN